MAYVPVFDVDFCTGCGDCVDVCPVEVFSIIGGDAVAVHAEECLGCCACWDMCPQGIITIYGT